jgi:hypothetical protein
VGDAARWPWVLPRDRFSRWFEETSLLTVLPACFTPPMTIGEPHAMTKNDTPRISGACRVLNPSHAAALASPLPPQSLRGNAFT